MQLLVWQDTDSVGVKELDDQHKEIFSVTNRFYDLMSQSKTKEDFKLILDELIKNIIDHFATEEKYFDLYQYDQKISHTRLHQTYLQKINQFSKEIDQNFNIELLLQMADFMKNWWIHHIDNEDKKYSQYFNQQGLY